MMTKTTIFKLLIFIFSFILNSCGLKVVDNHGFIYDTNVSFSDFSIGKTTTEEILNILGTPTTKSNFDGAKSWFYINSKFRKFVFLDGRNIDQKILIFRFDDNILEEKKILSKNDINEIDYEKTMTDSSGKKLNWMEQFFSNLNPNPFGINQ